MTTRTTIPQTATLDRDALKAQAEGLLRSKRLWSFGMPLLVLTYLIYAFFAFNVPGLIASANPENGKTLVRDSYSYKTHVTRDNRNGEISIAIEGERKGAYPDGEAPEWVALGEITVVNLANGGVVQFGPETVSYDIPGYGLVTAQPGRTGANATFPRGELPDWINASKNRVAITTDEGRLSITRNKTEVFRYQTGWELFFFTLDSPYHGLGVGEIFARAISGEAGAIWHDFWYNPMWMHASVAWALFETILMAFLGTFGAAILALPLAFLAAKNFTPLMVVRQVARRVFDFFRGVDAFDRGIGDLDYGYGFLRENVLRSFGKRRREADRRPAISRGETSSTISVWRDPTGDTSSVVSDPILFRIQYPLCHRDWRYHRGGHRLVAHPGDDHPKGLGRGDLLYRSGCPVGLHDGLVFGVVAP